MNYDPSGAQERQKQLRKPPLKVEAELGIVLEDPLSGFVGAIVKIEKTAGRCVIDLEDRKGNVRRFQGGPGFWLDGKPIDLIIKPALSRPKKQHTNSGSRAVTNTKAQVARPSRIWVEGMHDAQLVQHVWGEDLGIAGIVVEVLHGADHLQEILDVFNPTSQSRAGILLDHLLPNTKEMRIANEAQEQWGPDSLLIQGHPFVDIWQAVKPARVGLKEWPKIPRDQNIKVGTLRHLGLPHTTPEDIGLGWQRILRQVRTYKDLEPELLAPVEALIDFTTAPHLTEA